MTTAINVVPSLNYSALMSASPMSAPAADLGIGGMGPEEIIALAQNNMRSADEQIRGVIREIRNGNKLAGALGAVSRALNDQVRDGETGNMVLSADGKAAYELALKDLRALGEQGASYADGIEQTVSEGKTFGGGDHKVGADTCSKAGENIEDLMQQVNSGSELRMAKLQSLISQRQQQIQMATNMLQSLHQTAMAVLNNLGK